MFGRRSNEPAPPKRIAPQPAAAAAAPQVAEMKAAAQPRQQVPAAPPKPEPAPEPQRKHSEEYYDVKTTVFNALIDTIDLSHKSMIGDR